MNEWEWQLLEDKTAVDHLEIAGTQVRPGHRVILRPKRGGDVLDIALAGQTAIVECIEQDYEGKAHLCVVLDDDPGRDLGLMRQPGHRFFFSPEEIEPLPVALADTQAPPQEATILVAGIGNIFLGDDAFGVEVARRLSSRPLPKAVKVVDFGIRGFDLAYALLESYHTVILVDACPRGEVGGTLYVIEPKIDDSETPDAQTAFVETHGMNPMNVLRMAKSLASAQDFAAKRIFLVGCEPVTLGPEEGQMGLSTPVEASVEEALTLIESLVDKVLAGERPGAQQ